MILRILCCAILQFCIIGYAFGVVPQITRLNVQCDRTGMKVNVEFDNPFNGIIFSKGHYSDPNCRWVAASSTRRQFNFYIGNSKCGTIGTDMSKDSTSPQGFKNVIIIQNDPDYQEVWDSARKLSCDWVTRLEKYVTFAPFGVDMLGVKELRFPGDTVDCWMDIQRGHGPFAQSVGGVVPIGEKLTVVIYVRDTDSSFDVHVKDCYAYDSADYRNPNARAIKLTDESGCPLKEKLVQGFYRTRDVRTSGATIIAYGIINAFKFPERMDVFLACNVEVCKGTCPNNNCQPEVAVAGTGDDTSTTTAAPSTDEGTEGDGSTTEATSESEKPENGASTDEPESSEDTSEKPSTNGEEDKEEDTKDEEKKDEEEKDEEEKDEEKKDEEKKDEEKKDADKDSSEESKDEESKDETETKDEDKKDEEKKDDEESKDETETKDEDKEESKDDEKEDSSDKDESKDEEESESKDTKKEESKDEAKDDAKDEQTKESKTDDEEEEEEEKRKRAAKFAKVAKKTGRKAKKANVITPRKRSAKKPARKPASVAAAKATTIPKPKSSKLKKPATGSKQVRVKKSKTKPKAQKAPKAAELRAAPSVPLGSKTRKVRARIIRAPSSIPAAFSRQHREMNMAFDDMYQRQGRHIRSRRSVTVLSENATFPAMMHSISIISPIEDLDEKELNAWEKMMDMEGKAEEVSVFESITKLPIVNGEGAYCFSMVSLVSASILLAALAMIISLSVAMVCTHLHSRSVTTKASDLF